MTKKGENMKYTETVSLDKETIERCNALLEIVTFDDLTDEELETAGAKLDDNIPLFEVTFENGATLYYDVNSGNENYYDDMWMTTPAGDNIVFDCLYSIPSTLEVADNDGNEYVVLIEEEEESNVQ